MYKAIQSAMIARAPIAKRNSYLGSWSAAKKFADDPQGLEDRRAKTARDLRAANKEVETLTKTRDDAIANNNRAKRAQSDRVDRAANKVGNKGGRK